MAQKFGGPHTELKLNKLEEYLRVFTTVLKKQKFQLVYFDAFAGTPDIALGETDQPVFAEDFRGFLQGSSRRALKFGRSFSKYIFVEHDRKNVAELGTLKLQHPDLADRIDIRLADANAELARFCGNWPRMQRAVVFLDPFGNQVAWETVERIAGTKSIDLWYLFPAGLGVHRQIGKSGAAHDTLHAASLDRLLGTKEWRTAFAETHQTQDLFERRTEAAKTATPESITAFMIERMKGIFAGGVLDEWLPLGSDGRHSYSLIFACANPDPKAHTLALRLAKAVLRSNPRGRA